MYRGNSASGLLMMNITGMSGEGYTDVHFPFCIEQGDYFFVYQDTSGDGWGGSTRPAFLYITVATVIGYKVQSAAAPCGGRATR